MDHGRIVGISTRSADGAYEVIRIQVEQVSYLIALLEGIPHKYLANEAMVRNVRAVFDYDYKKGPA